MRAKGFKGEIHFDGAVNEQTLEQFITTKPNVLNVGSAIMSSKDMVDAYKDMVALVQKYSQN
jgi:pentose-5-phosphate-3-epimerase